MCHVLTTFFKWAYYASFWLNFIHLYLLFFPFYCLVGSAKRSIDCFLMVLLPSTIFQTWQPRMNFQQLAHPKSSANGIGRRKGEREGGMRQDNRLHSGKSGISKAGSTGTIFRNTHGLFIYGLSLMVVIVGSMADSKAGGNLSPSHDRLVYFSTCLIGHHVEVQVKNGSIYSGIYHAANVDKDMGKFCLMLMWLK